MGNQSSIKTVKMKFLVALSLIAAASAAQYKTYVENQPTSFRMVEERSFNGSPRVEVTFSDGYTDTMVLNKHYATEEDRMAGTEDCNYIGHLENEKDACVAMTGCIGSEDVEFTIMSTHATESPMFKWTREGRVEVIESPFKDGKARTESIERGMEQDWDDVEDSEVNSAEKAIEQMCSGGANCASVPATNLLQIRTGYGDGFLAKVGSSAKAQSYIKSAITHTQVFYCHSSLGTKIALQIVGDIKHYKGKSLQASVAKLQEMMSTTVADLGTADLMVYMGTETDLWGVVGIAYGSTVCDHSSGNKYKQSINEWRPTLAAAGQLIAHEMGHNLGMKHDFDAAHAAKGCNGKGIMSYGNPPNQWSSCSKADLQAHYITVKSRWCMDLAPTACDGSGTVPATVAPVPPPPPPAKATCNLSQLFSQPLNGNIMLTFNVGGKLYVSSLNCTNSICSPNVSGITNACQYVCGQNTCP